MPFLIGLSPAFSQIKTILRYLTLRSVGLIRIGFGWYSRGKISGPHFTPYPHPKHDTYRREDPCQKGFRLWRSAGDEASELRIQQDLGTLVSFGEIERRGIESLSDPHS